MERLKGKFRKNVFYLSYIKSITFHLVKIQR